MALNKKLKRTIPLLMLALCLSCQLNFLAGQDQPAGTQKLSPVVGALKKAIRFEGDLLPVIIEFTPGAPGQSSKHAQARGRADIVAQAGGFTKRAFLNFPSVLAMVDLRTLERLERHPLVKWVSFDHELEGNLYTTARAVGADQVWQGVQGNPGVTGSGVTVAVLDSGFPVSADLGSSRILKDFTLIGNLDWNVSGTFGSTTAPAAKHCSGRECLRASAYQRLDVLEPDQHRI